MLTFRIVAVAVLTLGLVPSPARPEQPANLPLTDLYQDFRHKRPLHDSLKLVGPDVEEAITAEEEGLRITLGATRKGHWPVEVTTDFPLSGDFEVTGTYELLSARRPTKGYGVGVHMNVA